MGAFFGYPQRTMAQSANMLFGEIPPEALALAINPTFRRSQKDQGGNWRRISRISKGFDQLIHEVPDAKALILRARRCSMRGIPERWI